MDPRYYQQNYYQGGGGFEEERYGPPPGPPPSGYGGSGYYEEAYAPPPQISRASSFLREPHPMSRSRSRGQEEYYDPPSGARPPAQYQQTCIPVPSCQLLADTIHSGAGYVPPGEDQQGYQPPYGQQHQGGDGPREQNYGPQMMGQNGTVAQAYFEYSQCQSSPIQPPAGS